MILATVSSDPAFSREVREVLAGSIRFGAGVGLGFLDVAGVGAGL